MRKYMLLLGAMLIVLVLTACGTNNGNSGDNPIPDQNEDPVVENNESDENLIENEPNDGTNEESTNSEEDLITETGIYNGQADPHTIEIETADGPLAFQLTMEARDDIDALTEGGEVTYTYTEDGDTRTIESIQMNES